MEQFLRRILGKNADFMDVEITGEKRGRYYRIKGRNGRIRITADSKPSAAAGLYRYLKEFLHVNYSWCGNSPWQLGWGLEEKKLVFPEKEIFQPVKQKYVSMFNYCTYGYSMAYWSWERWETELDYMLLNGVNLPLVVVGLEAVWYETLRRNGCTGAEALSFLSSPSHFPWQLMSNVEGIMPVMSELLIRERLALGQRIVDRMLELGMTPVQMGYSGFVPGLFRGKYGGAHRIYQKKDWFGHEGTCGLDPQDPLFRKIGIDFLQIQKELFGAHHFYACDPFHESEPPVKGEAYLRQVSRTIQEMYREFDGEYHWVMQSWSIRKEIVEAVPEDRLLILDLAGEKHEETGYFWGYDFVTGNLHNFGGRINLHGDLKLLAQNPFAQMNGQKNAVGTGLFMEGIDQNPLYYDLALGMLDCDRAIKLEEYLEDYCIRRYGSADPVLMQGLKLLAETAYRENTNGVEKSSMICARPALMVKKSGPNDGFEIPYDPKALQQALYCYLKAWSAQVKDGYYFDVYDMARQVVSNELQEISREVCRSYEEKNRSLFDMLCSRFLDRLLLADRLLLTRGEYNLYTVLNQAKTYTQDPEVNRRLVSAHRALLTVWSDVGTPVIFDYSWREWGGLIGTFYYVRWKLFFEFLGEEFDRKNRYCVQKENKLERCFGRESFYANSFYKKLAAFEQSWAAEEYEPVLCRQENDKTMQLAEEILQTVTREKSNCLGQK